MKKKKARKKRETQADRIEKMLACLVLHLTPDAWEYRRRATKRSGRFE